MAAAKSERVEAAEPEHDFWAIIDEELARMPLPLREVLLLCDLGGQSHAQAAESLGLAKGTVTKRLAKAREELATRLKRRGITLGVGALSTMIATQAPASVPAPLLLETARQAVAFSIGPVGGSVAAQTLAEGVMRSIKVGVLKVWLFVGLLAMTLAGGGLMLAGGPGDPGEKKASHRRRTRSPTRRSRRRCGRRTTRSSIPSSLPVSVAFSADGKTLLTGDTSGEVMALIFAGDDADVAMEVQGRRVARGGRVLGGSEEGVRHDRARRSHPRRGHRARKKPASKRRTATRPRSASSRTRSSPRTSPSRRSSSATPAATSSSRGPTASSPTPSAPSKPAPWRRARSRRTWRPCRWRSIRRAAARS